MPRSECYPEKAPNIDVLFDTLSNNYRREIIHYFENISESSTTSYDNLASHIEDRVPGASDEAITSALIHNHLPKLQSRGWLDFDARSNQIRYYGRESSEQLINEVADVFSE